MSEFVKTGIVAGIAGILAIISLVSAPAAPKSDVFGEQGKEFFPDFKDPFAATSLQVVEYDTTASAPFVFKVEFLNGKWTIPSHHDYPADGKDRLARTATSVIGIRKESVRSDRKEDHAICGVVDPEETGSGDPKDRGRRITLRNATGSALADLIIGRKADPDGKRYFVRVPGQKRVYAVKLEVDLSTKFADWIETDLTKIDPQGIWRVKLENYKIEQAGQRFRLIDEKTVILEKARDDWKTEGLAADEEVDVKGLGTITTTIDELKILGVRKKTEAMAKYLRGESKGEMTEADFADLLDKGYIPTKQGLLSKEGNLVVACEDGVVYELRFGAVFTGSGLDLSAGGAPPKKDDKPAVGTEARYLMIVCDYDDQAVKPEKMDDPPKSPLRIETKPWSKWRLQQLAQERKKVYDKAMESYNKKLGEARIRYSERKTAGMKRAKQLADRFADWYYVIGAESYKALHVSRTDVVKSKNKPEGPQQPPDPVEDPDHDGMPHPGK